MISIDKKIVTITHQLQKTKKNSYFFVNFYFHFNFIVTDNDKGGSIFNLFLIFECGIFHQFYFDNKICSKDWRFGEQFIKLP